MRHALFSLTLLAAAGAPLAAQTRLTDADLPQVLRLAEGWAEAGRRHRIEETDPVGWARAIDQALVARRALFDEIASETLDPLVWLRRAAPRLVLPPEARYLPQCSRAMTRVTAAALPASAAEGGAFPLPSPTIVFTLGEGSVSDYVAAAAREDSATVRRLEREALARRGSATSPSSLGELLGSSMAEVMGMTRMMLEPTGPAKAAVDSVVSRWRRDSTLALQSGGATVTARPRDLTKDSVVMVVIALPMSQLGAVSGGCGDLTPSAWMTIEVITPGPFSAEAAIGAAEAAIRAVPGAPRPEYLGSALWDACKAAAPYGAAWVAREHEDAAERALLTRNGAWFARHRARLEPLLLAARADVEDDACGMDQNEIDGLRSGAPPSGSR